MAARDLRRRDIKDGAPILALGGSPWQRGAYDAATAEWVRWSGALKWSPWQRGAYDAATTV